ncbi:hypothetical protein HYY74_07910 [Candidatus Woesearchaeota archaeon]|nr:hypothetical protein [Candidatus Woesearchaeota archaeon]
MKTDAVKAGLTPNSEVEVEVKRRFTTGAEVFGSLERKADTAKILKEIDEMFKD